MKVISLKQPWASLMALRFKQVETRSWPTRYRGPIAIHASKTCDREVKSACYDDPFIAALWPDMLPTQIWKDHWCDSLDAKIRLLPYGQIIAIGELKDCRSTNNELTIPPIDTYEGQFGNYDPERWMWWIANVRMLMTPVAARGSLGLWGWESPTDMQLDDVKPLRAMEKPQEARMPA